MTLAIGHCKHGDFILTEGCPQCMEECMEEEECIAENISSQEETATETALALPPGADIEVMSYYTEALKLQQYAEARVIATVEDNRLATDDLSLISRLKKAMEGKRKEYLEPLRAQVDDINGTYKILMNPVLEADKITRVKMLAFDAEQRRIRQEQEEINRLRREAAEAEMKLKGELTESINLVEVTKEPAKTTYAGAGEASKVDCWKYEVVDFAALPDAYKLPDTALLNTIAKKYHDTKQIFGVRFYNEPFISVRTNHRRN